MGDIGVVELFLQWHAGINTDRVKLRFNLDTHQELSPDLEVVKEAHAAACAIEMSPTLSNGSALGF
jgi:hypothetical protein